MPHIYPAAPPSLAGDTITISRFLNNPATVQRRLREITSQRFIGDVLLAGRYETTGGSLLYEQTEGLYTERDPGAVAPGAEYPRAAATPGPAALAAVTKWGQDTPITDEHVHRYGRRAVDVGLAKVSNTIIRQVDSICLAAIAAAVTQSLAATAAWTSTNTANILLDIALAKARIDSLDMGYEADTLVTTDEGWARLTADRNVLSGLTRDGQSVTATGELPIIAGLRVMATNYLPAGVRALVVDSQQLGGLGYERLPSPEYQGDPANGVESWVRRDPDANDQWLIRGRRPVVPVVQEPNAGIVLTGTGLA